MSKEEGQVAWNIAREFPSPYTHLGASGIEVTGF